MLLVDFFSFILDLFSDIYLIYEHRRNGDDWWFGLTLSFFLLSFLIVSIAVIIQDFGNEDDEADAHPELNLPTICLVLRLPFVLVRYAEFYLLSWKRTFRDNPPCKNNVANCNCRRCTRYKKSEHSLAWIHYIEAVTEAAPQWCLQVYIMFRQWRFPWWSVFSTVSSLVSLAWSITTLERTKKALEKRELKTLNIIVFFTYQLVSLFSRLFAIVIFSYVFTTYVFLVLVLHWLMMTGAIMIMIHLDHNGLDFDSCNRDVLHNCLVFIKHLLFAFPSFFHDSKGILKELEIYSPLTYYTTYSVISVENFILTITAVFILRPDVAHLGTLGPIALFFVSLGTVLGTVLSVVYYLKYHRQMEVPVPNEELPV